MYFLMFIWERSKGAYTRPSVNFRKNPKLAFKLLKVRDVSLSLYPSLDYNYMEVEEFLKCKLPKTKTILDTF